MSSVNKVILLGRLGRDPEVRTFNNGGKVCNFSVATSERWKDKQSGEQKERTEWHNVAIFSEGIVRVAEQYLSKGSQVYIEGQLEPRKWQDKDGNDRYSTEVVMRPYSSKLVLIGGKSEGGGSSGGGYSGGSSDGGYGSGQTGAGSGPDLEDEIPFIYEARG